ncbi:MAG: hypothetical protein P4L53_05615 [Candidatus Obscuribacterales bacterium]|nr:hypothetical protein [Candidatus Obscuribacterales bacterium]
MNLKLEGGCLLVALAVTTATCNPGWGLPGDQDLLIAPDQYNAQFDPWIWSNSRNYRLVMLSDLVNGHKLIGKTRNQIHEMLGKPEPTNKYDNEGTSLNSDTYPLNLTRCGNAGHDYLDISYRHNRVQSIRERCTELGNPTVYGKYIAKNRSRLAEFDGLPKLERNHIRPDSMDRHPKVTQL